jgi:oleate hydratase
VLLEESAHYGGALEAHGGPASGYFMSGSRLFESTYACTFDLLSSIPSRSDPAISVAEETERVRATEVWNNRARLVDRNGKIADFHALGLSERDRIDLISLLTQSERALDAKRISDCFAGHFFQTNFWFEWCTLFAFQRWHSAIEFKRYLLRFIHHFSTIDTQAGIFRTRYNPFDSIAVPLAAWLEQRGVEFRLGTTVNELGLRSDPGQVSVASITCTTAGVTASRPLGGRDYVFVTNGSMSAGKAFGSMTAAPVVERAKRDGAWRLWETLARGRPAFGNPAAFAGHVDESAWESFSVTVREPLFMKLMEAFSGSEPGRGGLITFKDSNWLLTLSIVHQPFFAGQPEDVWVWWGYGMFCDRPGNFVKKPMTACTGSELLEEVLGHLRFGEYRAAILAASDVIPCVMPYVTSPFLVRKTGDRPNVVPEGSTNLAFIGQFAELPDEVVFTVEYSVRSAQTAVYTLLGLERRPPPLYRGALEPKIVLEALESLHR